MKKYLSFLLIINTLFSILCIIKWNKVPLILPAHLLVAIFFHTLFITVYNITYTYKNLFLRNVFGGLYGLIWLIFYILVTISHAAWGQTITFRMIVKFLPTFPKLLQSMPFPQLLVYLSVAIVFIINQLICFYCVKKEKKAIIFPFQQKLHQALISLHLWKKIAGICIILAIFPFLYTPALSLKRWIHGTGEPFVVALRGDKFTGLFVDEHRLKVGLLDEEICRKYVVPDSFDRKNVVVIVIDAMRADHLPMYGYKRMTAPFLTQLYETQKLKKVERANATCACSECGVSSLFFGKTWKNIGYKGFNLVSLLKKAGYETHFLLSGYSRDWSIIYDFFLQDVDNYQENPGFPLGDDSCIPKALATVSDKKEKPTFMYIHLMSAHMGGIQSPKFAKFLPVKPQVGMYFDGWNYSEINNYHDNGILQADDMVRQIFDSLEKKNILQNAVVWLVSDHGESIGEHGYIAHTTHLYESVNRFPILIYDEDLSFYKNTKYVRQIDIASTIADRLGLPVPPNWEGQSMHKDSIYTYSYHQSSKQEADCYSLIAYSDTAIYKLIFNHDFSKIELYDIKKDSTELRNLVKEKIYDAVFTKMKNKASQEFYQRYVYVEPHFQWFN